jgi:predicted ester cyclase
MSIKENKELVRRVYELASTGNLEALWELYDPGYIEHMADGDITLGQIKRGTAAFYKAFPDLTFTVKDMVAEGDKVAYQVIVKGTHKGRFMNHAPTGNKIEMKNTCIFRIANGKVAEWWGTLDGLRMMRQLGAVPK